jgi:HSP20 family protein
MTTDGLSLFRGNRGSDTPARREEHPIIGLHRDVNRLFEEFWHGWDMPVPFESGWSGFNPRVDVDETEYEVKVTAELPGLDQKDFELNLADNETLVLKGEKREEREDKNGGWRERTYGRFERMISLPSEVDPEKVSAQFKNGVLTASFPKSQAARQRSKRIQITAS